MRAAATFGAVVMVIVGMGAAGAGAAPPDDGAYRTSRADLAARLVPLRRAYQSVVWPADSAREIGQLLKHGPVACRAFVRRTLRFEPYRGILRGPEGALAEGGGNSADLALLLREMLRNESGGKTRFAVGTLTAEQAGMLVDSAAHAPPARQAFAARAGPAATPPAAPQSRPTGVVRAPNSLLADARADLSLIAPFLAQLPAAADGRPRQIEAARQHVWLQVEQAGKWITLDPAGDFPLPGGGVTFVDKLPEDWNHHVAIKLEVEQLKGRVVSRQMLLEARWSAAELFGKPLDLVILPNELSLEKMLDAKGTGRSFLDQARRFRSFAPAVEIPGEPPQAGKQFDLEGEPSAPAGAAPLAVGGVDPFRRARAIRGEAKGEISGLFLTITLESPGKAPDQIERALLDRIGPAARAAGRFAIRGPWKDPQRVRVALFQRHQMLVGAAPVRAERLGRELLESLASGGVLEDALAVKYRRTNQPLSKTIEALKLASLPADLMTVQNLPLSLAQASVAGSGICFAGSPQVFLRSQTLDLRGGKTLVRRDAIDIARDDLELLGGPDALQSARLLHGIWASEIEGAALRGSDAGEVHAAQILRAAAAAGIELRAVRGAADLSRIQADADAKAVMASQLARGNSLIAPARMVPVAGMPLYAWWRIDPRGGVLAIGADGTGQAASEGQMVLTHISIPMVKRCMTFVACFNRTVAGGGGMNESAAECLSDSIQDTVKESLDAAIDQFVVDPLKEKVAAAREGMLGEDYNKLYEKAKAAYEAYQKGREAMADPAGQIPGVNDGRAAADAGRDIGGAMGFRIYLLLSMGRDITGYASKL